MGGMSPFIEHGAEEAVKPSEGCNLLGSQGPCDLGVSLASLPSLTRIAVGCRLRPQGRSQPVHVALSPASWPDLTSCLQRPEASGEGSEPSPSSRGVVLTSPPGGLHPTLLSP